jgi:SAM-dependent methyltransferase
MTQGEDPDQQTRRMADEALNAGAPTAWFDQLYAAADDGQAVVPWDRHAPHPLLFEWLANHPIDAAGKKAIVVGCGYGNDAELIAARGFETWAFDISPSAVDQARKRYPDSVVCYQAADLLDLPADWRHGFDLVVESLTVQSMPPELHRRAAAAVASLVGIGGLLVVISGMAADTESTGASPDQASSQAPRSTGPPWPLTADEIGYFATGGVERSTIETVPGPTGGIRWRAEFRRPDPEHDQDKSLQHWL